MVMAIEDLNKVDLGPPLHLYYAKLAKKFRHWRRHD